MQPNSGEKTYLQLGMNSAHSTLMRRSSTKGHRVRAGAVTSVPGHEPKSEAATVLDDCR
jgi:hypothetical protein